MFIQSPSVIDLVQEILRTTGWNFERKRDNLIMYEGEGLWRTYSFLVAQKEDVPEAFIQCQLLFTVPLRCGEDDRIMTLVRANQLLRELFDLIHADLPLGTFHSVEGKERVMCVNWSYRLRLSQDIDEQFLRNTIAEALIEINRFYPALALVLTGTVCAQEAFDTAYPDSLFGIA